MDTFKCSPYNNFGKHLSSSFPNIYNKIIIIIIIIIIIWLKSEGTSKAGNNSCQW